MTIPKEKFIFKKYKRKIPNLISRDSRISKYSKMGNGNFINNKVFIELK